MNNNVRIAKQLVTLAKELISTRLDNQIVRTSIADKPGRWRDFRGKLKWKGTDAEIKGKHMKLNEDGEDDYPIVWYGGVWYGGIAYHILWQGGVWFDGIFDGGKWLTGTWKGGIWKGGYDANGKWHDENDSPDKWSGDDPLLDPTNNHWMIYKVLDNGTEKPVTRFKMTCDKTDEVKMSIFKHRLNRAKVQVPANASMCKDGEDLFSIKDKKNGKMLFVMKKRAY